MKINLSYLVYFCLITMVFEISAFAVEQSSPKKVPIELQVISEKLITAILKQDPKVIKAIATEFVFNYFQGDIDAGYDPKTAATFYELDKDGYFPYEKSSRYMHKDQMIKFLVSSCETGFPRKKYQMEKTHFSNIKMLNEKRSEIVLKALCDASGVHFVFIKNKKIWSLVGYFFEAARVEYSK